MATHSSILAWRIPGTEEPGGLPSVGLHKVRHDWSDLAAAAAMANEGFPGDSVIKNSPAMRETLVWSLSWEDPLEKEMATHSSILAWRIPWTEEPGRLQSIGLQSRTWLKLLSMQWLMMINIFSYTYFLSVYFLQWNVWSCLLPTFNWKVFFYCWVFRVIYIFWTQVLCWICELQIFSPSLCFFIFMAVPLTENILTFTKNLFSFSFIS